MNPCKMITKKEWSLTKKSFAKNSKCNKIFVAFYLWHLLRFLPHCSLIIYLINDIYTKQLLPIFMQFLPRDSKSMKPTKPHNEIPSLTLNNRRASNVLIIRWLLHSSSSSSSFDWQFWLPFYINALALIWYCTPLVYSIIWSLVKCLVQLL